jgi:hypothetical protein
MKEFLLWGIEMIIITNGKSWGEHFLIGKISLRRNTLHIKSTNAWKA